jgi:HlyD family secretion protein
MTQPKPSLDDLKIERSSPPRRQSRIWVVISCFILLLLLGLGIWKMGGPKAIPVRVVAAREVASSSGDNSRTVLNASGYVTARREATVSSKITGKVVEVLIEEGMKVQENQVLARLDDTNVRAGLNLAEAQLNSAQKALAETKVRITEAEQELQRQTDLTKSGIATKADFDHAEAAALALKARLQQQTAEVEVAQRQVASWQQQLDDTIIRAPFGGIVTSKNAQPGEMISPISAGGGFTRTGIGTIVDMQSLEIEVDVNESYINRVEPGQPVEAVLDAYPEWKIPCKVIAIVPTADRQKSTVKVRVGFDKLDRRILPEMSIKVAFQEAAAGTAPNPAKVIVIPKAAVHQENGRDVVMVCKDGKAERRAVNVSGTSGDEAALGAGVSAGEKIIVEWPPGLTDGARVRQTESR